jgi:hypothetical protein
MSYPLAVGTIHSSWKCLKPPFFLSSLCRNPSAHRLVRTPAANGLKLFSAQCYKNFFVRNLRIFVISLSVCPWQTFPAKPIVCFIRPGAYPMVEHLKGSSIGQVPALQTHIRLSWKGLLWTNTLAYYENS